MHVETFETVQPNFPLITKFRCEWRPAGPRLSRPLDSRDVRPLARRGEYVFPGVRSLSKPISENTINAALRYLGFDNSEMTAHGFRAMARTLLDEVLGFRPDFIEHQLAHAVRDPLGRAYKRTSHLGERTKMMQVWADYLDALRS